MEKFIELEQKLDLNMDLLELARSYCELNTDKSREMSALHSVLDIIIDNQEDAKKTLDYIYISWNL